MGMKTETSLSRCAQRIAGHIEKPLDIHAIVAEIESDEYSAEMMLQHLLLWTQKLERDRTSAMAALREANITIMRLNSAAGRGGDDFPENNTALLDAAIDLLAGWCDAVKNKGTGWDDWDEWYKDACYRPGPLRELIDAKMKEMENA
jgi:hypothetical protein